MESQTLDSFVAIAVVVVLASRIATAERTCNDTGTTSTGRRGRSIRRHSELHVVDY